MRFTPPETEMENSVEDSSLPVIETEGKSIETVPKENVENLPAEQQQLPISNNFNAETQSHRAKAFILNTESNDWDEMATGICSPEPSEVKINKKRVKNN